MEDGNGQVGYVPVANIMLIIDETLQEQESDSTWKEGHENSTDGTKIEGRRDVMEKKKVIFSGSD